MKSEGDRLPRYRKSPAFLRAPEGNGCAERFIRTLKENLLWLRHFETIEELRQALLAFREVYNTMWLIERHGFISPAALREMRVACGGLELGVAEELSDHRQPLAGGDGGRGERVPEVMDANVLQVGPGPDPLTKRVVGRRAGPSVRSVSRQLPPLRRFLPREFSGRFSRSAIPPDANRLSLASLSAAGSHSHGRTSIASSSPNARGRMARLYRRSESKPLSRPCHQCIIMRLRSLGHEGEK